MEGIDKKQKSVQNTTLAVALITNFVNPFATTALNIAVPHIGKEFHASATSMTWIVLSFIFVTVLLSIPFGRIADIRGRKPILKSGILLICAASFLNIFSPSMPVFFLFRVLQGIGAAMIFSTNIAILLDVFPANKRGSVLGISVSAVYAGAALGPVAGGLITHAFGWRGVFLVISALALVAFAMAAIKLPKDEKKAVAEKLNVGSIVLFIVSLGLVMYGFATLTQNIPSYFILAAGVVFLVVFVRHELRTETPVIEVRLFSGNRDFSLSNLAAMFNFASVFAVSYLMSIYLQLVKGFNADVSGIIMISQPIIQVILSPIAGRLSDRKSASSIASAGMACCGGALFMFAFLDGGAPTPYIVAGLILTGVGQGLFSSPNSNVIMGSVPKKDYGIAASVQSTSRTFGQVIGMAVITIVINAVIGNTPIENVASAHIATDLHISFSIFAAICVIGIFISLKRKAKNAL
ncbi:MAG: MFS transporter [Clostridiales Family XIII bacterium]|jgi:EmrB/QacA subfamily drug resistance transporter|nr:MFS transporter [Clostridiales Family XIII bacterium]